MSALPTWFSWRVPNLTILNIRKKTVMHLQALRYALLRPASTDGTGNQIWKFVFMQEQASEMTSIGIVLFKILRENKNDLKSRLSNPSERGEGAAPCMCSSASDIRKKTTAFLQKISTSPLISAGFWQQLVILHCNWEHTTGEEQQRNEEGRKDAVSERVSHQHHEITCSEADHCFLAGKCFD